MSNRQIFTPFIPASTSPYRLIFTPVRHCNCLLLPLSSSFSYSHEKEEHLKQLTKTDLKCLHLSRVCTYGCCNVTSSPASPLQVAPLSSRISEHRCLRHGRGVRPGQRPPGADRPEEARGEGAQQVPGRTNARFLFISKFKICLDKLCGKSSVVKSCQVCCPLFEWQNKGLLTITIAPTSPYVPARPHSRRVPFFSLRFFFCPHPPFSGSSVIVSHQVQ